MKTKICSKCKQEKETSEFPIRKDRKTGIYSMCYTCKSEYRSKKYYKDKLENPINLWITRGFGCTKHRAKKENIIFSLTKQDIEESLHENEMKCIYCNKNFDFNGTMTKKTDSPTIDKIIPVLGYIKTNIVISCHRCNTIKNNASYEELINIGERLKTIIEKGKIELLS